MTVISIVVPVYLNRSYLKRCIDSIIAQSFIDFDLVLVDDGSTDGCGEICDEYALKDFRIHVIHQENRGLSAARNAGIEWVFANSDSEFLSFIDSDDWIHPQYLECLLKAINDTETKIAVCNYNRTSIYNQMELITCPDPKVESAENFWLRDHITATVAWGKIYARDLFLDIRYPEGRLHEDEFVTYKLLFGTRFISHINAKLYNYFINENGIILSPWTPSRLDALDAMLEQLNFFYLNGYKTVYQKRCEQFVRLCARSIDMIDKNVTNTSERVFLHKKWLNVLRRFIIENRKILSIKKCPRAYLYALPGGHTIWVFVRKLFGFAIKP